MKRRLFGIGLVVAASLAPGEAREGKIPVYQAGTTITSPGHYIVTRDISVASGQTIVTIQADGVTLDLGGHTLYGDPGSGADVIVVQGSSAGASKGITIRNGRIVDGFAGIYSTAAIRRTIRIEDLETRSNAENGIYISAAEHVEIIDCVVAESAQHGIFVDGANNSFTGRFSGNAISNAAQSALHLKGLEGGELRDNLIDTFGSNGAVFAGIWLDGATGWDAGGNLITGNAIRDGSTNDHGLHSTSFNGDNLIVRNTVSQNGADGIGVNSNRNVIRDNVTNGNSSDGISASGSRNVIAGNQAQGNGDYGLLCSGSGDHVYRDNMYRGNTLGATGGCAGAIDGGGNIP